MLSTQDIEALGKFIDSDMVNRWQGLSRKLASGRKITAANTGLYSSGKSSLFNALLGRVGDSNIRFPVGVIPTTKTGDREMLTQNIELLDTPGIDTIDSRDDDTAFDMLMQSDLILMAHGLNVGPIQRPEENWLKRIAGAMSRESIAERLIFVMTCTDEVEDDELQELRMNIRSQVTGILNNAAITFAEVSAKMYKAGIDIGNQDLQNASGILELKELVIREGMSYEHKAATLRKQELLRLCRETRDRLNSRRREVSSEIDSRKSRIRSRYDGAFEKWRGILGTFTRMKSGVMSQLQKIYDTSDSASDYQNFKNKIYSM